MATDMFRLMAAIKEMHRDIDSLRKQIVELRDELTTGGGGMFLFDDDDESDDSDDSDSSSVSVQSAPPTVSHAISA